VWWLKPVILAIEIRRIFQGQLRKNAHESPSQTMAEHAAHTCHNSYTVKHNRRFTVQASPIIKQDPISKITNTRRACRVIQVVEHLPSKCEPMSSNPSTTNEKKRKRIIFLSVSTPEFFSQ
jgi:hypothetical protein